MTSERIDLMKTLRAYDSMKFAIDWPNASSTVTCDEPGLPQPGVSNKHADLPNVSRSIKKLLLPLFLQVGTSLTLRADSLGFWRVGEDRFWLPRFVFQRR